MTASSHIPELVEALTIVRRALETSSDNDFMWSSWDDSEAAQQEMQQVISALEKGESGAFEQIRVLIAPTGPLQEVALQAWWSDVFQTQAERIETLLTLI